jgi:hypothetical protein
MRDDLYKTPTLTKHECTTVRAACVKNLRSKELAIEIRYAIVKQPSGDCSIKWNGSGRRQPK